MELSPQSLPRSITDNWEPTQIKFMYYLIMPANRRPSHADIAEKLGVSTATLTKWKNIPGFWPQVFDLLKASLGQHISDIWNVVINMAKKGDMNAIKMFMEEVAKIETKGNQNNILLQLATEQGVQVIVHEDRPEVTTNTD